MGVVRLVPRNGNPSELAAILMTRLYHTGAAHVTVKLCSAAAELNELA